MQIETALLLTIEMIVIGLLSFSIGYALGERRGINQGIQILNELKIHIDKVK